MKEGIRLIPPVLSLMADGMQLILDVINETKGTSSDWIGTELAENCLLFVKEYCCSCSNVVY